MSAPQVFSFAHDGRRMRVVASIGTVEIEQLAGVDALGVERWDSVDAVDEYGWPANSTAEWVSLAVLAVLGRGPQV